MPASVGRMDLRGALRILAVGLVGLALAAGVGLASSLISRDSVGLPATNLEPAKPLAPQSARVPQRTNSATSRTPTTTTTVTQTTPTVTDDHGGLRPDDGNSGGSGKGRSGGSDD
jgi:hypothetical protein